MQSSSEKILAFLQADAVTFFGIVPKGLKTTCELMDALQTALNFPEGFGRNWNALDDCLDDLSWIAQRKIVLIHEEFPHISDSDLAMYCQCLREASDFWKSDGGKSFTVIFL